MIYASVRVFLATKHIDEAKAGIETLRKAGGVGADVEVLAARVAKAANDVDGAWKALEAAALADPDRADVYTLEAELAGGTPKPSACADANACQIEALRRALVLEVMDASLGRKLFALLATKKAPDAQRAAERAFDVAPFDVALRLDLGTFLLDRGDAAGAARQLSLANLCAPEGELEKKAAALRDRIKARP
jgi:predicted Zn-dependent protease